MKNINNRDERTISIRMKIQSEAYFILVSALLISIVVQQFFLNAPVSQYLVEFLCLIICTIYTTLRTVSSGISLINSKSQSYAKSLLNLLGYSLIVTILFSILVGEKNIKDLLLFFVCFTTATFLMKFTVKYISTKKQNKINAMLDEDEDNI